MATRISNQSGQSLVLGLTLLPICIFMISGFVWLSEFVFLKQNQLELCRAKVLEQNEFAISQISELLATNKIVIALRAQRMATLAGIAAANASLNFELVPPLVSQLKRIEAQQKLLFLLQNKILNFYKIKTLTNITDGRARLQESVRRFKIFKPQIFVLPNFSLELPVKKIDDENPSAYEVDRKKIDSFQAEYNWQVGLDQELPLLRGPQKSWTSKCSARIIERNQKWIRTLNWDKP